jgi:hypothetical protein
MGPYPGAVLAQQLHPVPVLGRAAVGLEVGFVPIAVRATGNAHTVVCPPPTLLHVPLALHHEKQVTVTGRLAVVRMCTRLQQSTRKSMPQKPMEDIAGSAALHGQHLAVTSRITESK